MDSVDLAAELRKDNPSKSLIDLQVFADALATYRAAAANVRKNGAIVLHPRTGAPIENPFLKIQTAAGATLGKMSRIKSDRVVRLLDAAEQAKGAVDDQE